MLPFEESLGLLSPGTRLGDAQQGARTAWSRGTGWGGDGAVLGWRDEVGKGLLLHNQR